MFFWALSLPAQGVSLLFSRTFFSLQRPWITTALAFAQHGRQRAWSRALLYKPLGLARGRCWGPWRARCVMAVSQAILLREPLGGIEGCADAR